MATTTGRPSTAKARLLEILGAEKYAEIERERKEGGVFAEALHGPGGRYVMVSQATIEDVKAHSRLTVTSLGVSLVPETETDPIKLRGRIADGEYMALLTHLKQQQRAEIVTGIPDTNAERLKECWRVTRNFWNRYVSRLDKWAPDITGTGIRYLHYWGNKFLASAKPSDHIDGLWNQVAHRIGRFKIPNLIVALEQERRWQEEDSQRTRTFETQVSQGVLTGQVAAATPLPPLPPPLSHTVIDIERGLARGEPAALLLHLKRQQEIMKVAHTSGIPDPDTARLVLCHHIQQAFWTRYVISSRTDLGKTTQQYLLSWGGELLARLLAKQTVVERADLVYVPTHIDGPWNYLRTRLSRYEISSLMLALESDRVQQDLKRSPLPPPPPSALTTPALGDLVAEIENALLADADSTTIPATLKEDTPIPKQLQSSKEQKKSPVVVAVSAAAIPASTLLPHAPAPPHPPRPRPLTSPQSPTKSQPDELDRVRTRVYEHLEQLFTRRLTRGSITAQEMGYEMSHAKVRIAAATTKLELETYEFEQTHRTHSTMRPIPEASGFALDTAIPQIILAATFVTVAVPAADVSTAHPVFDVANVKLTTVFELLRLQQTVVNTWLGAITGNRSRDEKQWVAAITDGRTNLSSPLLRSARQFDDVWRQLIAKYPSFEVGTLSQTITDIIRRHWSRIVAAKLNTNCLRRK